MTKRSGPKPLSKEEVFWRYVTPGTDDECWFWTGSKRNDGYGQFMSHKKQYAPHRVSYELHHGPIPPGMLVCHTCDEPLCVNPAHLWLGTPRDNMADKVGKGRASRLTGTENPQALLAEEDIIKIRADPRSCAAIAIDYGVSDSAILAIKNRLRWRHVISDPSKDRRFERGPDPDTISAVIRLRKRGLIYREIGAQVGVQYWTVGQIIRAHAPHLGRDFAPAAPTEDRDE